MKKYFLMLAMFFGMLPVLKAQDDQQPKEEKIQALYVAYVTQQLNLNADEAQKFWPVHAQFEADFKATVKQDLPELEKQQALLNVKKKYQDNFNRILGPNRCQQFFRIDGEFKQRMLEKLRNHRQNRPGLKRGGGL
jgi:hypothetical protein